MFLFIGSEAMLFGAFFTVYFFVRVVNPDAPAGVAACALRVSEVRRRDQHRGARHVELHDALGPPVDQAQPPARAAGGARAHDPDGTAFLLTQAIEYAHVGFNTGDGAFASVFFGLTGLHGAHVFVGLTLLTIAAVRAFRGHYTPEHHHGVEIPGIYWHFVDVMWLVVYAAVYLL